MELVCNVYIKNYEYVLLLKPCALNSFLRVLLLKYNFCIKYATWVIEYIIKQVYDFWESHIHVL
jgi:hypothetical protein